MKPKIRESLRTASDKPRYTGSCKISLLDLEHRSKKVKNTCCASTLLPVVLMEGRFHCLHVRCCKSILRYSFPMPGSFILPHFFLFLLLIPFLFFKNEPKKHHKVDLQIFSVSGFKIRMYIYNYT